MRHLLLTGLIAVCGAFAQTDAPPAFEAASVKPNTTGSNNSSSHGTKSQIIFTNVSLKRLIERGYSLRPFQLTCPDWLDNVRFDISAKYPPDTKPEDRMLMLKTLLIERFKLQTHTETKEFPAYGLVAVKGKFQLKPVDPTGGDSVDSSSDEKGGELKTKRTSMARLAEWIAGRMDRPVVDMTRIAGVFDFNVKYTLESDKADADTPRYPVLPIALQEQLGLRLEKRVAPVEVVIVDHVEKAPTEN